MRNDCSMSARRKVLIVTKTVIGDRDGASLSLRNWLHGAFPTHVAQIYSGGLGGDSSQFPAYRLGREDRRFGRLFASLKGRAQGADRSRELAQTEQQRETTHGMIVEIVRRLSKCVLELGVWEILFKPRISPELSKFIQDFAPDLVVAQGFDLAFTWLPVQIHKQFGVPIATIIVDDWEPHLYPRAPRLLGMRHIIRRAFLRLLASSERRFCISSLMAREYEQRYGMAFEVLMQVDHRPLLNTGESRPLDPKRVVLAYSGSLGLNRWEGLLDVADALSALNEQGICGELRVYSPSLPPEAVPLQHHPRVRLFPHLPDDRVLEVLAQSDVVVLPESFDEQIRNYIRLSVSTKAHLYMMSGAVPLVYGPPDIGTVRYAMQEGWGVVVETPSAGLLIGALRQIIFDSGLRDRVVFASLSAFLRNHSPSPNRDIAQNSNTEFA